MTETSTAVSYTHLVAALYAALTLGLAPVSYGAVQVRVSEFMTLLAFYDKGLIPGLDVYKRQVLMKSVRTLLLFDAQMNFFTGRPMSLA